MGYLFKRQENTQNTIERNEKFMCGIVGYSGKENATTYLIKGLEKLEYRGYDSAGIAVISDGEFNTQKTTERIESLKNICEDVCGFTGIGHTRWATHGAPTIENAHPHLSCNKKFAVVHNGIIENYTELKEELESEGYIIWRKIRLLILSNLF